MPAQQILSGEKGERVRETAAVVAATRVRAKLIRGRVGMSRQQEEFKRRAADVLKRAERESGPYREVLLAIGEAFAALALHQGVLDTWPRRYPAPPVRSEGTGRDGNDNGKR
jgi:hypothetical protein